MLVERHHAAIYRLAFRHLGSAADAEDIVQDTFRRLFESSSRYRPDASFRTYLLTIAARLCLNRKRKGSASQTDLVVPGDLDSLPASTGLSPDAALARKERAAEIRRALAEMPADQRLALLLLRYEEASCEEIARILNRSIEAVHSLLYRARNRLAQLLEKTGPSREEEP